MLKDQLGEKDNHLHTCAYAGMCVACWWFYIRVKQFSEILHERVWTEVVLFSEEVVSVANGNLVEPFLARFSNLNSKMKSDANLEAL